MRWLALAACLLPVQAAAETWATLNCLSDRGTSIKIMINAGQGFITYGNGEPARVFSRLDGDMAIITHIASSGNMVMAVSLQTGRGYLITRHDNGRKVEANLTCSISSITR